MIGRLEARKRVLALWSPGATVHAIEEGLLVRMAKSQRVATDRAPGLPLVRTRNLLVAAPLDEDELRQVHASGDAVLLVRGGRSIVAETDEDMAIDPSAWLDVRH